MLLDDLNQFREKFGHLGTLKLRDGYFTLTLKPEYEDAFHALVGQNSVSFVISQEHDSGYESVSLLAVLPEKRGQVAVRLKDDDPRAKEALASRDELWASEGIDPPDF